MTRRLITRGMGLCHCIPTLWEGLVGILYSNSQAIEFKDYRKLKVKVLARHNFSPSSFAPKLSLVIISEAIS